LHAQWIYLIALRLAVSYSLLYSVHEVWFVSTCHLRQGNSCVHAPAFAHDLDSHCIRFCPSVWTPRFERVELCIVSARTTLAISAVAPL